VIVTVVGEGVCRAFDSERITDFKDPLVVENVAGVKVVVLEVVLLEIGQRVNQGLGQSDHL